MARTPWRGRGVLPLVNLVFIFRGRLTWLAFGGLLAAGWDHDRTLARRTPRLATGILHPGPHLFAAMFAKKK